MMAKIDYSLVYLKSENARMGLKQVARHLKKSPQRVNYSLSILEQQSVLVTPFTVFDYSYFGQLMFRVYFKAGYISEVDKVRIIGELSRNTYITSIYELAGEFDLVIEFCAPNPSRFNKELKGVASLARTLKDYKVILNVVTYVCPRDYMTESQSLRSLHAERILGGDREPGSFSANEWQVIRVLQAEPVARLTRLAKKTGLNFKTVKSIMLDLMNRRIIQGYRYLLDTDKLGISKVRLFLRLHFASRERDSDFLRYLRGIPEIVQISKTVGDWDMELDIEAWQRSRARLIIVRIRESFKDVIEGINIIDFIVYYKRSFLPEHLFSEEKQEEKK